MILSLNYSIYAFDLAILGGKITKLRPLNSSSLPNVQRMHIIWYRVWFIRQILPYDVFIIDENYIYVAIWTILITFYHFGHMFLENKGWDNNL